MTDDDALIGSGEACALLDVHRVTLTRWAQEGHLPWAVKLPTKNGAYLFRRSDVLALADKRSKSTEVEGTDERASA